MSTFRVGSIDAKMNFDTGGFKRGVRDIALGAGNIRQTMRHLSADLLSLPGMAGKVALGIGAVGIAGTLLARQLKPAIDASLELEHSFAFVRKTVDGTKAQLDGMSDSLRRMALITPISVKELNGVAAAAGQLGVARENVVEFTRIMAEMGIASDLSAEEAAVGFAQWANITGMAAEDMGKLTSAVVYLGNNTATTESKILNMTLRLASASRIVGITDAEMAGLSASLSSLGIWAESGGNAMSRIMFDMNSAVSQGSDELRLFAATAGKTADQFAADFKSAPVEAIISFVAGLSAAEKAGMDVTAVLEALGVTEMESRRAILGLAGDHEKLAGNIRESTRAFEENIARSKEANTLFDTGVSKVQLLKNATFELSVAVGENLTNSYVGLIETLANAVNLTSALIKETNILTNTISLSHSYFTGGLGRFLFRAASGGERSLTSSHALNQEGFGADKQGLMEKMNGGDKYGNAIKWLEDLQGTAKAATVEVGNLDRELARQAFKNDIAGMRDLIPSDVFEREAKKAVEIFRALPEEVTAEMRSAKFADMWKGTRDGFASVGEAAKQIPEEFRAEFVSAAGIVETEIAAKAARGGAKLTDEIGKALERAMEEAVRFRIDLFPEEQFAESVKKVVRMAEAFPETLTGEAVARAFDNLITDFRDQGVDAVRVLESGLLNIPTAFESAMRAASQRAKTAAMEVMMEAQAAESDSRDFESAGDFRRRGRDRFASLMDPGDIATMLEDTRALTAHLQELVDAGTMDSARRDNILSLDYWETVRDAASMSFEDITHAMRNFIDQGQEIPAVLHEAMRAVAGEQWRKLSEGISRVGESLKGLGANAIGGAISSLGSLYDIGRNLYGTIKSIPALFATMKVAGVSAAITIGTALRIALNVIALIADAVRIVIELFGLWGDEGKKELKGMAKVIDEIKEASDQWIDSLTDKLVDAIKTGQFAWRDFVNEVLDDLTRIAVRELVVSPVADFVGGALGFKDGGAFDKGHVVNSPEYFNTKSGPAVRGEAGTEVVMPAVRLGDGTLGVKAAGGGSQVFITVEDNRGGDSPPVRVSQSAGPDGEVLVRMVLDAVKSDMIQGGFDDVIAAGPLRRGGY